MSSSKTSSKASSKTSNKSIVLTVIEHRREQLFRLVRRPVTGPRHARVSSAEATHAHQVHPLPAPLLRAFRAADQ